jgi:redox-sensitive bicupin YhaK (pirin superfamily)
MFPLLDREHPNTLELFQIWINLPKASKFAEPYFKMLWSEDIPMMKQPGAVVRLIAGELEGARALQPPPESWAANKENDVLIALVDLDAEATYTLPPSQPGSHRRIFHFEGDNMEVNGRRLPVGSGAELAAGSAQITNGSRPGRLLVLQGRPIKEKVAKYGPFVMNEPEELNKAMEEYRLTQFGGWPWPYPDQVHPREKGRFAQYPDGTLVEK